MGVGCEESLVMGKPTEKGGKYHESREASRPERRPIYAVLRNSRCRTALSTLGREGSMDEAMLAAAVLAAERDVPVDTVSDDDAERVLYELYHVHLPKLEATGLVSRADGMVRTCLTECHEVVPGAQSFVDDDRNTAAEYLRHLDVVERRAVLTVLSTADGPMDLAALAAAIGGFDSGSQDEHTHDKHTHDTLCLTLHHVHLPMLDQTGLVRYDHETRVVELTTLVPSVGEAA